MKHFLFSLILFTLVLSCNKDESNDQIVCNSGDPIENMQWFNELKQSITNCTCEWSIIQGTYMGQTVVWIAMTDILCDGIFPPPTVYHCNGEPYIFPTQQDHEEFYLYITDTEVLYKCKW